MAAPDRLSPSELDIQELAQDIEEPLNESPTFDEPALTSVDFEDVEIAL
jgi:hypothetical protein